MSHASISSSDQLGKNEQSSLRQTRKGKPSSFGCYDDTFGDILETRIKREQNVLRPTELCIRAVFETKEEGHLSGVKWKQKICAFCISRFRGLSEGASRFCISKPRATEAISFLILCTNTKKKKKWNIHRRRVARKINDFLSL